MKTYPVKEQTANFKTCPRYTERWTRLNQGRIMWDYNILKENGITKPNSQPNAVQQSTDDVPGLTTELITKLREKKQYHFTLVSGAGTSRSFWNYPLLMHDLELELGVEVNKTAVRKVCPPILAATPLEVVEFSDWAKVSSTLEKYANGDILNQVQLGLVKHALEYSNGRLVPTAEALSYCPGLATYSVPFAPLPGIAWDKVSGQVRPMINLDKPLKSFLDIFSTTKKLINIPMEDLSLVL